MNSHDFTVLVSGGSRHYWVSMCTVWLLHSKWMRVEQQICIESCIKLEHSSAEIIGMIQKATAMGNWWLEGSLRHHDYSCITCHAIFLRNIKSPRGLSPFIDKICTMQLVAFPKTRITSVREEISDHRWDSGNTTGQLMGTGRTVWGPNVLIWKGTEVSLSYVQRFLYLLQ